MEGHSGGRKGRFRDAWSEAARTEGFKLRDEAEAMLKQRNPWDARMMKSSVDPKISAKSEAEKEAQLRAIGNSVVDALKKSGVGMPEFRIGDNQVAKSQSKATARRSRP
jgi:hypothetical protein